MVFEVASDTSLCIVSIYNAILRSGNKLAYFDVNNKRIISFNIVWHAD